MAKGNSAIRIGKNILLLMVSSAAAVALCEGVLRLRYAEPLRLPTAEILAIQPYLKLDADVGFTWNAGVPASANIVFDVADVEFAPLSTDEFGLVNHPDAIARRQAEGTADIVALGDSFMEHGAHDLYTFFKGHGLSFYSLAIHRQSPPQYTTLLKKRGLPLNPRWVLYGVFENDFAEAVDYARWKESGLDWFHFHSGTWCGAPLAVSPVMRFRDAYLRGFTGLYRVLRSRLRGDNMTVAGPRGEEMDSVLSSTLEARDLAAGAGARFIALLIPGRGTAVDHTSPESKAYDGLRKSLESSDVDVLDLRTPFWAVDEPASLYYREDAHWNKQGIALAGEIIWAFIETAQESEEGLG